MNWQEVTVSVNKSTGEAVANIMVELGSGGVIFTDDDKRVSITAYFPAAEEFEQLLWKLKERTYNLINYNLEPGRVEFNVTLVKEQEWTTSWHDFFKPTLVGKEFLVCPTWEDCADAERTVITINPGMAFGIGSHESTRLCIRILEDYLEVNERDINTMLDIGTGTGILSIVATKLGLKDIYAVDISKAAVKASRKNFKLNGVEARVRLEQRDLGAGLEGNYPLVVANLLPQIILRLLPEMVKCTDKSGLLILSGIIETKRELITARAREFGLSVVDQYRQNEWWALVCRKG